MSADLAAFLLARVAEDERESQVNPVRPYVGGWHRSGCDTYTYDPQECDCGLPARVLREVAAKRAMLPHLVVEGHRLDHCDRCRVLRLLSLPYAEHEDYREEWKP